MANVQRFTVKMSQDGPNAKDSHTLVLLARPDGAVNVPDMEGFCDDMSGALRAVMFDRTYFQRISVVQVVPSGKRLLSVPDTGYTKLLGTRGDNEFPIDNVYSHEAISLAIEKSTATGQSGRSNLAHCVTAQEFALYLLDSSIPERFTESPVGSYGAGELLKTNLLAAAAANNYTFHLPPKETLLGVNYYPITDITAGQFVDFDRTKKRISSARALANAVQRKLNEWAKKVRDLIADFTGGTVPAGIILVVNEIVQLALDYWSAVAPETKALVRFPALLALL